MVLKISIEIRKVEKIAFRGAMNYACDLRVGLSLDRFF